MTGDELDELFQKPAVSSLNRIFGVRFKVWSPARSQKISPLVFYAKFDKKFIKELAKCESHKP